MKYTALLLLLFFTFATPSIAKGPGSSAVYSLLNPLTAFTAGMAEACVGIAGEPSTMGCNPAGPAGFEGGDIYTTYQKGLSGDTLATLLLAKKISSSVLGTYISYYTTGEVTVYNTTGDKVRETGQQDIVFAIGNSRSFSDISLGFNIKFISSEIFGKSAFAFGGDMGAAYRLSEYFRVGMSIQNLTTKIRYITEDESLPLIIRPGISYQRGSAQKLILTADMPYHLNEKELIPAIGIRLFLEKRFFIAAGKRFALGDSGTELDELLNIGWGFYYKNISFAHSAGFQDNLDNPQRLTFALNF